MYDDVNSCPVRIPDEDGSAPPVIEPSNCHKGFPIGTCGGPVADQCLFPDECPAHPFVESSTIWEMIGGAILGCWYGILFNVALWAAVGVAALFLLLLVLAFGR